MGVSVLLESMTAAASVGMGCGTCCGSGISTALYGYLTTHTKDIRHSVKAFCTFFFGKFLAVVLICCGASLVGTNLLDDGGRIWGVKAAVLVDGGMLAMGIWLLLGWFRERRGSGCQNCKACKTAPLPEENIHPGALLGMGFGYGISPCAPLILITGYGATLPVGFAAILGAVFALASTVSPALFLTLLSGALAKRMRKEIPQYLTWFRLGCYLLLIGLFAFGLAKEAALG